MIISRPMIRSISIDNVRLFSGTGWTFPIHPLQVFCGTNSAGKSTLLKTLLLLRQSVVVPESYEGADGRLRFVSNQADLGNYASFVSNNMLEEDIRISITIEDRLRRKTIEDLISMKNGRTSHQVADKNTWLPYTLTASFRFSLDKKEASLARTQGFLKEANFEIGYLGNSLLHWKIVSTLGKATEEKNFERYELLVPSFFSKEAMGHLKSVGVDKETDFERYQAFLAGLLPAGVRSQMGKKGKKLKTDQQIFWPLPTQLHYAQSDLERALKSIHYLGPLRTPAQRYYVASLDDAPDFDSTGAFLPSILHQRGNEKIFGGAPGVNQLSPQQLDTLEGGLNHWLHYLRTGEMGHSADAPQEIKLSATKDVLVELLLRAPSGASSHALTDSGFGYSQVLPILVRGLLASPNSTLIIEQPELHLNPGLQVRLAVFFIEMVKAGKQVLIETHSEHLVNAIRVLAAEDPSNEVAKRVGIIFMEMTASGPVVHNLNLQPDGTVPDWPPSFFGEAMSLSSRLLKAQRNFISTSKPSNA